MTIFYSKKWTISFYQHLHQTQQSPQLGIRAASDALRGGVGQSFPTLQTVRRMLSLSIPIKSGISWTTWQMGQAYAPDEGDPL